MSFEDNPAEQDPHGECRNEIKQLQSLLGRVYRECGNEAPAVRRHALTPGLRDDIRDYLKTTGFFEQNSNRSEYCDTDCGDGTTIYDDRPRR